MGKLVRCISRDGTLVMMAADTTDMVERSQQIHKTSAVTSAALGRLLTASSLMGSMLKGENESITLRINGGGPAGTAMQGAMFRIPSLKFRSIQRASSMLQAHSERTDL